ncbi:hypothetical protein [Pseudanabaena sp. PCC 6802]|nr:hypothetical protein [Pseudanabaena sp. PCC 6802]
MPALNLSGLYPKRSRSRFAIATPFCGNVRSVRLCFYDRNRLTVTL